MVSSQKAFTILSICQDTPYCSVVAIAFSIDGFELSNLTISCSIKFLCCVSINCSLNKWRVQLTNPWKLMGSAEPMPTRPLLWNPSIKERIYSISFVIIGNFHKIVTWEENLKFELVHERKKPFKYYFYGYKD